jgi:hypothetical protein
MILSDLKAYMQQRRRVVLNELIVHFNMDANALRGMLSKWISKGKIKKSSTETACGTSCCKCDPAMTEIYEWLDD